MLPATHDFGATLQFGEISAVDAATHRVRVRLPALENMETDWLPMLTQAAGGNRFYCLPDTGELAVCLLDARGEGGVCLGTVYNDADVPPAADSNLHILHYRNGTYIEHDRSSGNILIKTAGTVTIDAPNVVITGHALVQGSLTYLGGMTGSGGSGAAAHIDGAIHATGNITSGGISLPHHTHTGDSGGQTGQAQ